MPAKVFISYSRHDEGYKTQVVRQLMVLERQGLLSTWSDDRIEAGATWYPDLLRELDSASIVILLITANFLTSDFILREEIPRALEQHERSGIKVIPVYCRPCPWEAVGWLAKIQIWPRSGQPLWKKEGDDPASDLSDLAREIARLVTKPTRPVSETEKISIYAIDDRHSKIDSPGHQILLADIVDVVRASISVGAPLYNKGDKAGCARIYSQAVRHLATLSEPRTTLPDLGPAEVTPTRGMPPEGLTRPKERSNPRSSIQDSASGELDSATNVALLAAARTELMAATRFLAANNVQRSASIAWQIRRVFDRLLLLDEGAGVLKEIPESIADPRRPIGKIVHCLQQIANTSGVDNDEDFLVGLNTSASLGVLACRAVLSATHDGTSPRGLDARRSLVDRIERAASVEMLTLDSGPRVAWRCLGALHAFATFGGSTTSLAPSARK